MATPGNAKRIVFVYSGFILFLILISFLILFLYSKESHLQRCISIQIPSSRYNCLMMLANSTNNASICRLLTSTYQYSCYELLATKTGNISLCKYITNSSSQYSCYSGIALASENASICKISNNPGSCYAQLANKTLNASLCSLAGNETGVCLSIVYTKLALLSGRASDCNNVPELTNQTQLSEIIANVTTPELANESLIFGGYAMIPNETYTARDLCLLLTAYATHNSTACTFMPYSQLQTLCIQQTTSYSAPNLTLNYSSQIAYCESMGPKYSTFCEQSVTTAFAIKNKNATYCKNLQGSEVNACYSYVAMAEKNESLCSMITNSTLANACREAILLNEST